MTLALYRRWRPQRFEQIIGQDHITRTLKSAVIHDRVAHGFLFCGPRGVAKTTTARVLAKAINCEAREDGEPCDRCEMCRSIASGASYDVIEMDAASNGLIENVRDLRQNILAHPDRARRKVYILDEAHRMSAAAFDALLKTLEEPPPHVVFILVTSDPDRIPATIVSRCQRFDFRRLAHRGIVERLREICHAEGTDFEPGTIEAIARAADGSLRDAQSILDQVLSLGSSRLTLSEVEDALGTAGAASIARLVGHIVRRESAEGVAAIHRAIEAGADPRQLCREVSAYLRAILFVQMGASENDLGEWSAESRAEIRELAPLTPASHVIFAVKQFGIADANWRGSLHYQLPLELAFIESVLWSDRPESAGGASPRVLDPAADSGAPRVTTLARPDPRGPGRLADRAPSTRAGIAAPAGPEPSVRQRLGRPPLASPTVRANDEPDLRPALSPVDGSQAATLETSPTATKDETEARRTTPETGAPEDALARWRALRAGLADRDQRLASFLADVRIDTYAAGRGGPTIRVLARSAGHQEQFKRNQRVISTEWHRLFGEMPAFSCSVAERWEREGDDFLPTDSPPIRRAVERGWIARIETATGDSIQSHPERLNKESRDATEHADDPADAAASSQGAGGPG